MAADITAPLSTTFEEGDAANDVVVVVFSEPVSSADFLLGVTITVNATPVTVDSAVLQGDGLTVYYTLNAAGLPDANDDITWEYDAGVGDIVDASNNDLASVATTPVTNDIGRHLRFNDAPNSMQMLTIGL